MATHQVVHPFRSVLYELYVCKSYHVPAALAQLARRIFTCMQHPPAKLAVPVRNSFFTFFPQFPHDDSFQKLAGAAVIRRLPENCMKISVPVLSAHRRLGPDCYLRFIIYDL
jgi:hypothetical protein